MGWGDSIPIVEGEIGPPRTGFVHRLCIRKADEAWGRGRAPRRPRGYKILQILDSLYTCAYFNCASSLRPSGEGLRTNPQGDRSPVGAHIACKDALINSES